MDEADSPLPDPTRDPNLLDVVGLCRELNRLGAKYIVVGGFAIIRQGYTRTTTDIDLLVDDEPGNQQLVLKAMESMPDQAVKELEGADLRDYIVVRVADEVLVDLMTRTCGISYKEAESEIEWLEDEGVRIPYASKKLLWRMKQTHRDKDELDRIFLREKLRGVLCEEELHSSPMTEHTSEGFLRRLWRKIF
jgi:hypothetical protein